MFRFSLHTNMIKFIELYLFYVLHVVHFQYSVALRSEKPVAEKIWSEPCNVHSRVLNDCNWCRCTAQKRYTCDARICTEIDAFGHFNDAIKDIDVGMEGHGVWRSTASACQPGVHYQRGHTLCICDEDGNWPNPTCRDIFRVLYQVDVVENVKTFKEEKCTPSKLYLIGCNVCSCPPDGIPNPKYCTRKSCSKDDPIFGISEQKTEIVDVYATCNVSRKYKLGCKNCICIRNNRLLCDNCTKADSQCSGRKPGEVFNIDCNSCQCDEGILYCTVKRCLEGVIKTPSYVDESQYTLVERPLDYINCVGGTKFKLSCKTCYCYQFENTSSPYCDTVACPGENAIGTDCVEKTLYEKDCLLCYCVMANGKKMEMCRKNPVCKKAGRSLPNLSDVRGYCEPLHIYRRDCNTCVCLADGKTVKCSTYSCQKQGPLAQTVDIVPVVRDVGTCPKGRSFKIDCNVCFCLSNSDVLCTTAKCRQ